MLRKLLIATASLAMLTGYSQAQNATDEEEPILETVIVTGSMRVTQGGAQDIQYFKGAASALSGIPEPGTLTAEGLLSSHDLELAKPGPCEQLFCLNLEAMPVDMLASPQTDSLLGLGFGTNLTEETWQRDPITLIAVVDKSGSMGGEPLEIAKQAMKLALSHLNPGDRMGVVQYGSTTDLVVPVMEVGKDRKKIKAGIDSIYSSGSTYMEAGLKLAYDTAFEAQRGFDGTTRVMLFTDERPNVGNTDKDSFIGMAVDASERGVGLTTIGVADHFGAELANQVAAARGGNLFYMPTADAAESVFAEGFDFLMTEIAQDLSIQIEPGAEQKVTGIYGVPGDMITYTEDGGASFVIPSVFLSTKSGGVFIAMEGDADTPRVDVSMTYKGVVAPDGEDSYSHKGFAQKPSDGLKTAALLVDQYQVLNAASTAYHDEEGMEAALELTTAFAERLDKLGRKAPEGELDLMRAIEANLKGAMGLEFDYDALPSQSRLDGEWYITRVRNRSISLTGKTSIDLRKGDWIMFDIENRWFEAERMNPRGDEEDYEEEPMRVNEKQIYLEDSDILFGYKFFDETLQLRVHDSDLVLTLKRQDPADS